MKPEDLTVSISNTDGDTVTINMKVQEDGSMDFSCNFGDQGANGIEGKMIGYVTKLICDPFLAE